MEKEKQFYVLISINNLEYLKDDGYTSDEIDEAVRFDKPKQALKYLKLKQKLGYKKLIKRR